jgi:hypothetical protein
MEIKDEKTAVGTEDVPVAPAATEEEVSSPEVKEDVQIPEETPDVSTEQVQTENVDLAKTQAQLDNIKIALKQERETRKAQEAALAESKETIDKLKNVFVPEQPEEQEQESLTMSQIEEMLDRREARQQEEAQKQTQQEAIKQEVSRLEAEWNGENGKPKYEDKKVLQWQEDNNKLHLSPSEAFNEMSRDSIIDWEIKNRLNKKPEVQNVETPAGVVTTREPEPNTPKTTADIRNAVIEAMSNASTDNTN